MSNGSLALCLAAGLAFCSTTTLAADQTSILIFHASQAGMTTLDEGDGGGNPFARALVDVLSQNEANLSELPSKLETLTVKKSHGLQTASGPASAPDWQLVPKKLAERRIALVLVNSDYAKASELPSLPGARSDSERIAKVLTKAGFTTQTALDLDLSSTRAKLKSFAEQSVNADVAVIYTTGHGVEVDGTIFHLPIDYPIKSKSAALPGKALKLDDIAVSSRARKINLVFYGGCRNDPFTRKNQ